MASIRALYVAGFGHVPGHCCERELAEAENHQTEGAAAPKPMRMGVNGMAAPLARHYAPSTTRRSSTDKF